MVIYNEEKWWSVWAMLPLPIRYKRSALTNRELTDHKKWTVTRGFEPPINRLIQRVQSPYNLKLIFISVTILKFKQMHPFISLN
jgi:hypothetical protein